jgi:AcrR family transcriptional regulator
MPCYGVSLTAVKLDRETLLAATLRVLDRDGIAGLNLRAVGREAHVSAPALYWHFDDKEALVVASLRAVSRDFVSRLRSAADAAPDDERLAAAGDAFVRYLVEHPHRFQLLFRTPPRGTNKPLKRAPAPNSSFGVLVTLIREGMTQRVILVDDPVSVALSFAALGQGLVALHERGRFSDHEEFAAFARLSFRRLMRGLAP